MLNLNGWLLAGGVFLMNHRCARLLTASQRRHRPFRSENVEFCPKCGGLLRPVKKGRKTYLVCKNGDYKKVFKKKSTGYTLTEKVDETKRRDTVIVEEEPKGPKKRKEELEAEREETYASFLEQFETEEEEAESEGDGE